MRRVVFLLASLLLLSGFWHGALLPSYQGPCDLVTCAEAYSVTRSMKAGYSGALFQLSNGVTTLDIGQTNHVVDLTTWSAFCSGVAANCVYAKFYAQINTGSNDLVPSVINQPNPNCSGGGPFKCASAFTIEAATGLPIIATVGLPGPVHNEYTLAADINATGITGAGTSESIIYNGKGIATGYCCGSFGTTHRYVDPTTIGTDFMVMLQHGTAGGGASFCPCSTSSMFCVGIEEETLCDMGDYGTAVENVVASVTFDSSTNKVSAMLNGHSIFSNRTPAGTPLNSGLAVHLGGGGDLSQPAPTLMREALVTNSALSGGEQNAVLVNMTAFYSGLSFP